MMEISELNHSTVSFANSQASSKLGGAQVTARTAPRSFVDLPNLAKSDANKSGTGYKNNESLLDVSVSESMLKEKLKNDHIAASRQREEESKIRFELENSKVKLIEQYQLIETKLTSELGETKSRLDTISEEKDTFWGEKLASKQEEVDKLQTQLQEVMELYKKRMSEKENTCLKQLEQQEEVWKGRLAEVEDHCEQQLRGMQSKYAMELDARALTERAKLDSKEEHARISYEKKLKRYEAQVQQVIANYRDKELLIHGSLDEARKEIILARSASDAKEAALREELALKDKRVLTLQSKLHAVDDITRIADSWRENAKLLSRLVVNACVSIQDLPAAPVAPQANPPNLFVGLTKEDADMVQRKHAYHMEMKAFNRLRRENVLIQKDLIAKALKNSKVTWFYFSLVFLTSSYSKSCVYTLHYRKLLKE
jgi:hypothetical protein